MHNVLKGIRFLSHESLDAILKSINASILDYSTRPELDRRAAPSRPHGTFELRLLDSAIGPQMPWPPRATLKRKFVLPTDLENAPRDLVLARLRFDERMEPCLADCDLAVLDRSIPWRTNIAPLGVYVVSLANEAILRHVRPGRSCLYLAASDNLDRPLGWDVLPVASASAADVVKARVVWIGRQEQLYLNPGQCGRFLVDATSS